jgi:hypothetical protein
MIVGMQAAELALIQADFTDLFNGCDAADITLTWETGTPDPVYPGKWIGAATVHTQAFRGIVVFASAYRTDTGNVKGGLLKRKFAELPDADIAILMPASITMKGLVNVLFDIPGLGKYRTVEKPGEDLSQYALMYPAGQPMIQWVFARSAK